MGLDEIFGALLLGTWAASILFGIVWSEAYKYFTLFPNDPWSRKGLVILTLAFGLAALVGDYANTYLPVVTYWGNTEAIQKVYWPLPLYSIMNTLLGIIVDCYLIFRFYSLSKNIWATLFLYALILLAFAGYLMGFIPLVRGSGSLADRENARIGAMVNFIAMVVCDMLIAAGLIWKLRSMRSSFSHTNTFMNRIMIGAIQTGSATGVCSILLLITFLNNPESNVATFFIFLFAPLYSLTLLLNFNIRRSSSTSGTSRSKTSESRGANVNNNILMDGIHVHRTIMTINDADSEVGAARRRDEETSIKRDPDAESIGVRKITVTALTN
ncbi:hypothetical protein MVEN_01739600 [Mycena venus]|uniref:DUF6534 domain-containing protein n=1 Tax=Mycena venus TaxID=2733690 RepID=A0A8H7CP47_9AGAR|nr:hypothetical protein MVEN_01739600 [Mycena venus]